METFQMLVPSYLNAATMITFKDGYIATIDANRQAAVPQEHVVEALALGLTMIAGQ